MLRRVAIDDLLNIGDDQHLRRRPARSLRHGLDCSDKPGHQCSGLFVVSSLCEFGDGLHPLIHRHSGRVGHHFRVGYRNDALQENLGSDGRDVAVLQELVELRAHVLLVAQLQLTLVANLEVLGEVRVEVGLVELHPPALGAVLQEPPLRRPRTVLQRLPTLSQDQEVLDLAPVGAATDLAQLLGLDLEAERGDPLGGSLDLFDGRERALRGQNSVSWSRGRDLRRRSPGLNCPQPFGQSLR